MDMNNSNNNAAQTIETNNNAQAVHPFEAAGLGKAPFKYAGMVYQAMKYGMAICQVKMPNGNVVECETQPGGTCDYCGQYIVNMFRIESADGKNFKVGCDCVAKVAGDNGTRKVARQVAADVKALNKSRRDESNAAKVTDLMHALENPEITARLAEMPHPMRKGETFLSYARWMQANAGISGKVRTLAAIKARLK